jgi:hypothetical protein
MKIRLEYIILGVLVIGASLYLILRERDRVRYKLPKLETVDSEDINRIEIKRKTENIELVRSGERWEILPDRYKADNRLLRDILNSIQNLTLADLVSVSKDYDRFELDDTSRIEVTAYEGEAAARRFSVGSSSRTSQHTYIAIPNDTRVFHARGDLRSTFDRDREELRDKMVLSFDSSMIEEIELNWGNGSHRLVRSSGADTPPTEAIWESPTGATVDSKDVVNLIRQLSNLRCTRYLSKDWAPSQSLVDLHLRGDKSYRLEVFEKSESEYPGTSSEADSAFMLSSYVVEEILGLTETH